MSLHRVRAKIGLSLLACQRPTLKLHRQSEKNQIVDVSSPRISVLIPTYNYARYLAEAIESVLAQDFRDFELLIVDDCSADNTAEVVKPYCARDARVRFTVNSTNLGMVNNWNYCLEQARGKYIKFLFGDDKLWHPQALSKMTTMLERHPSATLAASARTILDERSRVVNIWRPLAEGCHNGWRTTTACLMQNGKNLVGEPSATMFRKKDGRRGFDPKYRQIVDLEMWFYLLEKGGLVFTGEPLCAFRQHAQQQSALNDAVGLARKEQTLSLPVVPPNPGFRDESIFPPSSRCAGRAKGIPAWLIRSWSNRNCD